MTTHVTTHDAAQALGTTPDALRKALQRDPDAPQPLEVGGSHLWDLDALIAWDQQRTRRTGRTTADKGRPIGSFALTPQGADTTGIVTAWWSTAGIRFDIQTIPSRHEIPDAATLPGIDHVHVARNIVRNISRHLTGVSEIGGDADPLEIDDPAVRDMVDQLGAALMERIIADTHDTAAADGKAARTAEAAHADLEQQEQGRRVSLVESTLRRVSDLLAGDFGPWSRGMILGVTRMEDWALGDVQRALEVAFPGDVDAQRSAFLRVMWARMRDDRWPGPDQAEKLLA